MATGVLRRQSSSKDRYVWRLVVVRRLPFLVVLVSALVWPDPAQAQGPPRKHFYSSKTVLGWASCRVYTEDGSETRIPFMPVTTRSAPCGTLNYTHDIGVEAPVVFVSGGPSKREIEESFKRIPVKGKAVLVCMDSGDLPDPRKYALGCIEAAASHDAAAIVLFSAREAYPILRFPNQQLPEIPAIVTNSKAAASILAKDVRDLREILKVLSKDGASHAEELSSELGIHIDGAFERVETEHFVYRFQKSILSRGDAWVRENEKTVPFLLNLFACEPSTWQRSNVTLFGGFDSKVFYWGTGKASEQGMFMVCGGGKPKLSLLAHENAHLLIWSIWGISTSFMTEGVGMYAEAEATEPESNHRQTLRLRNSGAWFPLAELLSFNIGSSGGKTTFGYPASGSFVAFIVEEYSLPALKAAYQSENRSDSERNEQSTWEIVFGKSIEALEQDWLAWLDRQDPLARTVPERLRSQLFGHQ